jgi:hypothetical protein
VTFLGVKKRIQLLQIIDFVCIVAGVGCTMKLRVTRKKKVILVDYCNLPIKCTHFLLIDHLVKVCLGVSSKLEKEASPIEYSFTR